MKKNIMTAEDQKARNRQDRARAVRWLLTHEREERYLISFSIEYSEFEKSFEWLRSVEARSEQKFYDFQIFFESLKAKMSEFRWSKDFLLAHGIDFAKAKKQYFAMV